MSEQTPPKIREYADQIATHDAVWQRFQKTYLARWERKVCSLIVAEIYDLNPFYSGLVVQILWPLYSRKIFNYCVEKFTDPVRMAEILDEAVHTIPKAVRDTLAVSDIMVRTKAQSLNEFILAERKAKKSEQS